MLNVAEMVAMRLHAGHRLILYGTLNVRSNKIDGERERDIRQIRALTCTQHTSTMRRLLLKLRKKLLNDNKSQFM